MSSVPDLRIRTLNQQPIAEQGQYVLYWMIANRRANDNFSLQHAAAIASDLGKPLLVLEALRCDYPWASDRLHRFVMQGMADNAQALQATSAGYYPYLEPTPGAGRGLLRALANKACLVVTDDFPAFFLPRMVQAAAKRLPVRLDAVDSNGLLPMRAAPKVFSRAFDLRRFLQKELLPHLAEVPLANALQHFHLPERPEVPAEITQQWPATSPVEVCDDDGFLASLPIDHGVPPSFLRGGTTAAQATLREFIDNRLADYGELRNQPSEDAASGFSPYLHFGHLSVHQVFDEVTAYENWNPQQVAQKTNGQRSGWWNMSDTSESFLDELITWRELGYNFCSKQANYDQYESLPDWAQATLAEHASDPREYVYSLEQFEQAQTHDPLWNAAQRQLVREGRMHNYLRMLWGKKILHWTATPQHALQIMIHLNNKYALDGRNPNSYSGIFWVLGRYDRAWGPDREIFGKIRYMTSDSTARKLRVGEYLEKYSQ